MAHHAGREPGTQSAAPIAESHLAAFVRYAQVRWGAVLSDADALQAWKAANPERFWGSVWDCGGVMGKRGERVLAEGNGMPGSQWFPDARLNFAQNLLRNRDQRDALVFWGEDEVKNRMSHGELYRAVARFASALRDMGVVSGDRVAARMPNMPEAIIAMLAATSIGAIFTAVPADLDVQEVIDRFGQTQPKVLIAADGYFHAGKIIDSLESLREIARQLPWIERVVVVPYVHAEHDLSGIAHARMLANFIALHHDVTEIAFTQLPFNHPVYLTYSPGPSGASECVAHGAGGVLLLHLEAHWLHCDVRSGDRMFCLTACGSMLWNWLASGLATGATLLLFDGFPFVGDGLLLFDYADAEGMTHFCASAHYIDAIAKAGLRPGATHELAALRAFLRAGSYLSPEWIKYVRGEIKENVGVRSICLAADMTPADGASCYGGEHSC